MRSNLRFLLHFLVVFHLLLPLHTAAAQTGTPRFRHLRSEDQLSGNTVTAILKDRQGFMWFGTYDGLDRYDGYGMQVFRPIVDDEASISHGWITAIIEDRQGRIWVGTFGGGLNRLNADGRTFTRHRHRGTSGYGSIVDRIQTMSEGLDGTIWIGTLGGGLLSFDPSEATFQEHPLTPAGASLPGHLQIRAVLADRHGDLWIGSSDGGLGRYDPRSGAVTHFENRAGDPHSLSHNNVRSIVEDPGGTLWIGTNGGGLNRFDPDTGVFERIRLPAAGDAGPEPLDITSLHLDTDGSLWIATFENGLFHYDTRTGGIMSLHHDPADPLGPGSDNLLTVYPDDAGLVWIGTMGRGLDIFDTREVFAHLRSIPGRPNTLSHPSVGPLLEDSRGIIWIGTNGGGLNRYDPRTGDIRAYRSIPEDPATLSNNNLSGIVEQAVNGHRYLWIGTFDGLNRFDPATERFVRIRPPREESDLARTYFIRAICSDGSGGLWIGAGGQGLDHFAPASGTFRNYRHDPADPRSLNDNAISTLLVDSSGILWVGTVSGGLNRYDAGSGVFTSWIHDPDEPASLPADNVSALFEDERGDLWLGTMGGGLSRFDRGRGTFTNYPQTNGLSGGSVSGIVGDDSGSLWLGTLRGLVHFTPESGRFQNYTVEDGLQSDEFNLGSALCRRDGRIMLGGINGVTLFDPADVTRNEHIPPVVLTSFRVFDHPRDIAPIPAPTDEVVLRKRENFIAFEFAALDYRAPARNRYAYMLEGFDPDWIESGTRRYASYTNLSGGRYLFRVRGSNNHGVWNEEGLALHLRIVPPLWRTAGFQIGGVLILLLLTVAGNRTRTRYITTRNRELEEAIRLLNEQIEERKSLEEQLRQSQKMEAVGRLAGGVAHDFNNLLTVIGGNVEMILMSLNQDDPLRRRLEQIKKASNSAAELTHQLLAFSRKQVVELRILDLNEILGQLENMLRRIIGEDIELTTRFHPDPCPVQVDPGQIEQVLVNLAVNARDAMPDGGSLDIATTVRELTETGIQGHPDLSPGEFIVLSVRDTGHGMSDHIRTNVFEPFFTTKSEGTGLGLATAYGIVTQHRGAIEVASIAGKGTLFTIYLPRAGGKVESFSIAGPKDDTPRGDETVMLVEDEEAVRELAAEILKDLGYHTIAFADPHQALAYCRDHREEIALLITDLVMPGMNGVDLAREIRNLNAAIGVLFMSGYTGDAGGELADADAEFISKPFSTDEFARKARLAIMKQPGGTPSGS